MAKRKQSKRSKNRIGIPASAERPAVTPGPSTLGEIARSKRIRFAIAFALFCIAFYAIIEVLPPSFTKPVNENTAWTLGVILNAFGIPASTSHDTVSEGEVAFKIVPECTPIFTAGLFLGFIVFYPATLRRKLTGLMTGIPALYLGNLARLAATFTISRYDRRLFEVVHVYLGQVFTIFLVILVCITWLKRLDQEEFKKSMLVKATGFLARFALIASGLFAAWTHLHHWYIWLLDQIMLFGFSLFDYHLALARKTVFYYETFSIVGFTSLLLAARSIPWFSKIKGLAAGLGILLLIHLFHRIDNVLMAYFNYTAILPVDLTLLIVGQYLLPVLLLIFLFNFQKGVRHVRD